MNWNILVAKGKKINRDSVSSGEWKRRRPTLCILHDYICTIQAYRQKGTYVFKHKTILEKVAKEGESPVRKSCVKNNIKVYKNE